MRKPLLPKAEGRSALRKSGRVLLCIRRGKCVFGARVVPPLPIIVSLRSCADSICPLATMDATHIFTLSA